MPSGHIKRYKKNEIVARFCQITLKHTAYPSPDQIHQLQQAINGAYLREYDYFPPQGQLRSQIKEYFRKRREYMTSKIYAACDDVMTSWWQATLNEMSPDVTYDEVVKQIVESEKYMNLLMFMIRLPVTNEDAVKSFIKKRVVDYFYKMCEMIDKQVPLHADQVVPIDFEINNAEN